MEAVHDKKQVFERVREHRAAIRQFGAARLGLFGSFVRGQQRQDSDVDFVVEFQEGKKTFRNFIDLAFYLEEVMARRVDLLTWEGVANFVKREMERDVEYAPLAE